jgi:hypothetical protein
MADMVDRAILPDAQGAVVVGAHFHDLAELREALVDFRKRHNNHWILERLQYRTPAQARRDFFLELGRAV